MIGKIIKKYEQVFIQIYVKNSQAIWKGITYKPLE